jgi:hypothetical protein
MHVRPRTSEKCNVEFWFIVPAAFVASCPWESFPKPDEGAIRKQQEKVSRYYNLNWFQTCSQFQSLPHSTNRTVSTCGLPSQRSVELIELIAKRVRNWRADWTEVNDRTKEKRDIVRTKRATALRAIVGQEEAVWVATCFVWWLMWRVMLPMTIDIMNNHPHTKQGKFWIRSWRENWRRMRHIRVDDSSDLLLRRVLRAAKEKGCLLYRGSLARGGSYSTIGYTRTAFNDNENMLELRRTPQRI